MPDASVALCHEWLSARHGSEKTFEAMAGAFPSADLYALTWNRASGLSFGGRAVSTTFIDRLRPLRDRRMFQLPLMPLAWRYATRRHHDVVVTSSHACAKGFWPARDALHLCYCYTPMRYLWLSSVDSRRRKSILTEPFEGRLRSWDLASIRWVDEFAAISNAVSERIRTVYDRPARVVHPPVDTEYFTPGEGIRTGGFALAVSRMVPYKRLDLAIRACRRIGHPLVVAGAGPAEGQLRSLAAQLGADVRFVISPDDAQLRDLYRSADALVFPAEEDFGIVPVEAQACGTPVVAIRRGGVLDTVVPEVTGVLVAEADEESLAGGLLRVLDSELNPSACRSNAEQFSVQKFQERFLDWVTMSAAARGIRLADPQATETV